MDAFRMAKHSRRGSEDTAHTRAYQGMLVAARGFQDVVVQANPIAEAVSADGGVLIGSQDDRGWAALMNEVFSPEYVTDPRLDAMH